MSTALTLGATDWIAFLGRLHPLVVHLPIGMLAAVVIAEFFALFRKGEPVSATRRGLLLVAAGSAVAAAVVGWFLADEGGYPDRLLFWHRWTGIGLAAVLGVAAVLAWTKAWKSALVKLGMVGCAAGLVTVAGHLGGSMTHGETYLTRYAPGWVAKLLGQPAGGEVVVETVAAGGDAEIVLAMLRDRCVECHGASKQKGGLRLDEPAGIESVVFPGDPSMSELFRRIAMDPVDPDFMPPDGGAVDDETLMAVMRWIRDGASLGSIGETLEEEAGAAAEDEVRIGDLRASTGAYVTEIPGGATTDLTLDFTPGEGAVGPGVLEPVALVGDRVVELNFSGRSIDGLPDGMELGRVRRLRLDRTDADDAAVAALLGAMPGLESLNLSGTPVTDAVIDRLAAARSLGEVVLHGTGVTATGLERLRRARPDLRVVGGAGLAEAFAGGGPRLILAADASKGRIALMREVAMGRPETLWEHEIGDIHDLHLLDSGNVLFQTSWTRLVEVNPETGEEVWSYDAAARNRRTPGERVEVHAFQRLADGATMIAESGPARIIEVDRDGTLLSETPLTVSRPDAHHDTRLVRKTDAGTYLVAHEWDGFVREYDKSGEVVWSYDVPSSWADPASGQARTGEGDHAFSATRLANGNTLIGMGNGRGVIEVDPAGAIVWSVGPDELEGVRLAWVTTVQVLSNGNVVIGNCHAGEGQPQIVEITREKEVVWTFGDFDRFGNALSNSYVTEDGYGG